MSPTARRLWLAALVLYGAAALADIAVHLAADVRARTLMRVDARGNMATWMRSGKIHQLGTLAKVLPDPGSLSTQIFPPCISTNLFVSVSPRPVPSRFCA